MHTFMVTIGNFFFRYRNTLFPFIIVALFALAAPPEQVFESEALECCKDIFALALSLSGLGMRAITIGYAYIKRGGMQKRVYAENLVTEGMFGVCRNPLYVGNILIYMGVFLMHGNPLVFTLGTAFYLFVYQCIVLAEEAYLAHKFGEGYAAYCRDVPRWLPRFSRFKDSTEGMAFQFKRVLFKDYTTIASTFIILALTEEYEKIMYFGIGYFTVYEELLAAIVILCGIGVLAVRTLKKRASIAAS